MKATHSWRTRSLLDLYRDVITVYAKCTIVLLQSLECGHVGRVLHDLIDPFDRSDHFVALLFREHRRTFVLGDLL